MMSIEETWARLERWLQAHLPLLKASLNSPATSGALGTAERKMGLTLPHDLRALFSVHDGQRARVVESCLPGGVWMSLQEVTATWQHQKRMLDAGEFEDVEGFDDARGRIVACAWSIDWIPLIHDGSGNYICVDMGPGPRGVVGQVIQMWHDDEGLEWLASSLHEWLAEYVSLVERGEYVAHRGEIWPRDEV